MQCHLFAALCASISLSKHIVFLHAGLPTGGAGITIKFIWCVTLIILRPDKDWRHKKRLKMQAKRMLREVLKKTKNDLKRQKEG